MLRNVAQWIDVPLEAVRQLPALALQELIEDIQAGDPRTVQGRKKD